MNAPKVATENQRKIAEFDKAIDWWQTSLEASLKNDKSELQQDAKRAILRKLKHERRKLREQEEGTSLVIVLKNMRDTAIETYDDFAGYVAENFNELFEGERNESPETPMPSEFDDRAVNPSPRTN
uniref:Uncharacterized protein n=1 Tax=Roseihalotalea indica TaxID=2867963 RepID=A0AA49GQS5_9BACT|nr:hypothetical protein K4G66_08760 [Tunicatimonas sp. TK19036]